MYHVLYPPGVPACKGENLSQLPQTNHNKLLLLNILFYFITFIICISQNCWY
ncbi:hypothetical protein HMPREF3038_02127 [Akkermansia sp. KLE1797]|nr:hypothetical protein HMPREF3038_02127 [Akkermansia sp. KLE1797]